MKNYLLLCGGVGGAKLALGFSKVLQPSNMTIVVNTGDDFEYLNLKICPDLDTVIYTLSGESDSLKGWGRADESWTMLKTLGDLGGDTWFQLGDKDLATHFLRTDLIKKGASLSFVSQELCKRFNVDHFILPMTDDLVETYVQTKNKLLSFQEYFVKLRCEPLVSDFVFKGLDNAKFNPLINLSSFNEIIICPSNPFVSINPIIQLSELNKFLKENSNRVSVISPIVEAKSLKGPTSKIMNELGLDVSVKTIASFYQEFADTLFIDRADSHQRKDIENLGFKVFESDLIMNNLESKIALAKSIINYLEKN